MWDVGTISKLAVSGGPLTVNFSGLDSIVPSAVQMAPCASQSVVAGSSTATSALESGLTLISHPMLGVSLPGSSRRAPTTSPPVTVNAWSRQRLVAEVFLGVLAEPQFEFECVLPLCDSGLSWVAAVGGWARRGSHCYGNIARTRLLVPPSSVKLTRTLMVLPSSSAPTV